jgi:hypothetical protein
MDINAPPRKGKDAVAIPPRPLAAAVVVAVALLLLVVPMTATKKHKEEIPTVKRSRKL